MNYNFFEKLKRLVYYMMYKEIFLKKLQLYHITKKIVKK